MKKRLLMAAALSALGAWPARAQVFSPAQVQSLVGKDNGAETRVQIFYHYFKKDRDSSVPVPAWVDQTLDAMLAHPVWRDSDEGVLNEAQLWQAPLSELYEFFELTRKTFLPSDGGQLAAPASLSRDYEDNRMRFLLSLDRLYRARLGNSLGGRGRAVMANFDLILKEMDSLVDGLTSGDIPRYRQAVMAVGTLSQSSYEVMHEAPRGYAPAQAPSRGAAPATILLQMLGLLVVFLCFFFIGSLNEDKIAAGVAQYREKVKQWAYDYERQFVVIKVNYLVGVPAALGLLLGILTFNPFGLVIFAGFGIYTGLILPGWLLRNIKFRRGLKVEAQLMDAMILMSNGLKAGVDMVQCLEMVHQDLQPPISEEFGLALKNYQLGTSLEKALEGIEERVQSRLLAYMIKAVVIQRSVGGNLTKIFDRIVDNIREEAKLAEKTAAMTAQQRIQAIVVGVMPWIMLIIMFVFQPQAMQEYYFTPLGVITLFFCTVWIGIGMQVVNKLGDISV